MVRLFVTEVPGPVEQSATTTVLPFGGREVWGLRINRTKQNTFHEIDQKNIPRIVGGQYDYNAAGVEGRR